MINLQKNITLTFSIDSAYTPKKLLTDTLYITQEQGYKLSKSNDNLSPEDRFYLRLDSLRQNDIENATVRLEFNPTHLLAERVSPQLATKDLLSNPESVQILSNSIELYGIKTKQDVDTLLRLAKFHFKALKAGTTEVLLFINDTFMFTVPLQISGTKNNGG